MEQKENGWWKEKLNELRNQIYAEDCESSDFDPYTIELRQELEAFISQVEQDARKDERERVIVEAIKVLDGFILPGDRGIATIDHANDCLQACIKAIKGLSDNNK